MINNLSIKKSIINHVCARVRERVHETVRLHQLSLVHFSLKNEYNIIYDKIDINRRGKIYLTDANYINSKIIKQEVTSKWQ